MKARAKVQVPRSREAGAPKDRLKGEVVPPIKTLQLMKLIGVTDASKLLGVSMTTLHKARKHNLVSRVIEVAAAGELRRVSEEAAGGTARDIAPAAVQRSGTIGFMLQVAATKRAMVEQFAKMIGADVVELAA